YMSPEQVRGEELDARSDLFSLGVVLYQMATGRRAFIGNTSGVIFEAILNRAPTALIRLNPNLPPKLEEMINRLLEKDRDMRYQGASDLHAELRRLRRDISPGNARGVAPSLGPVSGAGGGSGASATATSSHDSSTDRALVAYLARRYKKALLGGLAVA